MREFLHGPVRGIVCALLACFALQAVALETGDTAPDFSLRQSNGEPWRLEAHRGQPVIVMFWATWCPYCKKLFPGIQALHDQYAEDGLSIVAVNFRDDADTDRYKQRNDLTLDVVLDGDDLAESWGVEGTPTLFVIDAEGDVRLRSSDSDPDNPELHQLVAELMAEADNPR